MRKALFALILMLVPATVYGQDWPTAVKHSQPSILRIEIADDEGNSGFCTGVVIAPNVVATAAHCVPAGGGSLTVARKHVRKVLKLNRILDIAVLQTDKLAAPALAISQSALEIGSPVAIAGYALGFETIKFQFGYVSDPAGEVGLIVGPLVDARIFPGDSGGALIAADGSLITLNRVSLAPKGWPSGFAGSVDPQEFKDFIEEFVK